MKVILAYFLSQFCPLFQELAMLLSGSGRKLHGPWLSQNDHVSHRQIKQSRKRLWGGVPKCRRSGFITTALLDALFFSASRLFYCLWSTENSQWEPLKRQALKCFSKCLASWASSRKQETLSVKGHQRTQGSLVFLCHSSFYNHTHRHECACTTQPHMCL